MKHLYAATAALILSVQSVSAAEHPVQTLIQEKCKVEFGPAIAKEKARYFTPLILKYARKHNLPPEIVAAVVWHESNYRPTSRSSCGAIGLMQVMPFKGRFRVGANPYDPEINLDAGCRLLQGYLLQFKGDWHRALTAYNWGPGFVSRGMSRSHYSRAVLKSAKH